MGSITEFLRKKGLQNRPQSTNIFPRYMVVSDIFLVGQKLKSIKNEHSGVTISESQIK